MNFGTNIIKIFNKKFGFGFFLFFLFFLVVYMRYIYLYIYRNIYYFFFLSFASFLSFFYFFFSLFSFLKKNHTKCFWFKKCFYICIGYDYTQRHFLH